jgi:hypothetical protein
MHNLSKFNYQGGSLQKGATGRHGPEDGRVFNFGELEIEESPRFVKKIQTPVFQIIAYCNFTCKYSNQIHHATGASNTYSNIYANLIQEMTDDAISRAYGEAAKICSPDSFNIERLVLLEYRQRVEEGEDKFILGNKNVYAYRNEYGVKKAGIKKVRDYNTIQKIVKGK